KVFKIPFRPSASTICKQTSSPGAWYDKKDEHCYNGYATKIAMPLKLVSLPQKAIISVSYNTSDYGAEPQRPKAPACDEPGYHNGAGCPFDSLNVGAETALSLGSQPLPEDVYLNSTWSGAYCDEGASGTGTFRRDAGCWGGYQPSFEVTATER